LIIAINVLVLKFSDLIKLGDMLSATLVFGEGVKTNQNANLICDIGDIVIATLTPD
jgi:hypothetical protein